MLEAILAQFPIPAIRDVRRIAVGLINETYHVTADGADFILQKLNPIFAPEVLYDIEVVSSHLERNDFTVQKIIKTKKGKLWFEHNGGVWRLFSYIQGEVVEKVENNEVAYEAGKILGKFHCALKDLKYTFKHHRPLHHATEILFQKFQDAMSQARASAALRARSALGASGPIRASGSNDEIRALEKPILELPKLLLPKTLRKTITHGDPKITNVIFARRAQSAALRARSAQGASGPIRASGSCEAVSLIDLDDVGNQHNVVIELGDALRSWCATGEDDPQNIFSLEKFEAAMTGYTEGSKKFLQKDECKLIPKATKLITIELASRFLRDYIEDSYFGWDPSRYSSRQAHNLARTRGQISLYHDICKKEKKLNEIISSLAN